MARYSLCGALVRARRYLCADIWLRGCGAWQSCAGGTACAMRIVACVFCPASWQTHAMCVMRANAELSRNFAGNVLHIARRLPVVASRAYTETLSARRMPCARRVKPAAHSSFAQASLHRAALIAAHVFAHALADAFRALAHHLHVHDHIHEHAPCA